jgi:hypothetical protein
MAYEPRDQMGSASFFTQSQAGKLGDAADVVEWAGDDHHDVGLLQELSVHMQVAERLL